MIRPPSWCAGAIPDKNKGWVDPNSGDILISSRFTQADIDEFYGLPSIPEVQKIQPKPEPAAAVNPHIPQEPEPMVEAIEVDEDDVPTDWNQDGEIDELEAMSKIELELLGREHGVELDRRLTKEKLVETMRGILSK